MRKFISKCFHFLARRGFFDKMSDKTYLTISYLLIIGKRLNLKNPQLFTEKMQWAKIYDHNPLYTELVDKYKAKKYAADIIGEEHIIPTLGIWDKIDDIDFDSLPNEFVLKCTHDSGGIVICKDKNSFNAEEAKETLNFFYNRNYYLFHREWPYKNVPHRILAEKYMVDESGDQLKDYKFWCFDGEPKIMFVVTDRYTDSENKYDYFDMDFNRLELRKKGYPNYDGEIKKPDSFEEMKDTVRKLAKGFAHVRIDLYDINGKIYFGEFTFTDAAGYLKLEPKEYDSILGDMYTLPKLNK